MIAMTREVIPMLDEKDLQAIQTLIAANNETILNEATHRVRVLLDAEVTPKFNLLAEGIQDIQEKLVPRSRVDDLEDEVKFLKIMIRQMAERISTLEKAN